MGCDIHVFLERKVADKWVMVKELNEQTARERNYNRFGMLANVRRDVGPECAPKGLPDDISESTALNAEDWEGDGHSHSWVMLEDAAKIWHASDHDTLRQSSATGRATSWYFEVEPEDAPIHRLVFWFDN